MSDIELVKLGQEIKKRTQGIVEQVGRWLWISFSEYPGTETIKYLRMTGCYWNPHRKVWQFSNGVRSKCSKLSNPLLKTHYGAVEIKEEEVK